LSLESSGKTTGGFFVPGTSSSILSCPYERCDSCEDQGFPACIAAEPNAKRSGSRSRPSRTYLSL
jgi:hypothetical protein